MTDRPTNWGDHALTQGLKEELGEIIESWNVNGNYRDSMGGVCEVFEKYFGTKVPGWQPDGSYIIPDAVDKAREKAADDLLKWGKEQLEKQKKDETKPERLDRMESQIKQTLEYCRLEILKAERYFDRRSEKQQKCIQDLDRGLGKLERDAEDLEERLNKDFANRIVKLEERLEELQKDISDVDQRKAPWKTYNSDVFGIKRRLVALEKKPTTTGAGVKMVSDSWVSAAVVEGLKKRLEALEKKPPGPSYTMASGTAIVSDSWMRSVDERLHELAGHKEDFAGRIQSLEEGSNKVQEQIAELYSKVNDVECNYVSLDAVLITHGRQILTIEEQIAGLSKPKGWFK